MKQVLSIATVGPGFRQEAVGWTCEDPSLVRCDKPIGLSGAVKFSYIYDCVLRAMADGWELIGPPVDESFTNPEGERIIQWGWYLQRECAK